MESSLIRINVGNIVQVFTSVVNPNATFVEMNGFTIRVLNVIPNPTMPLFEFTVEILYIADNLTTNLNLTCGNSNTNKTLTTVNSVPCIYPTSGAMNPSSSHSQNDEGTFDVVVSLGIPDDFELSATLQCVVTLQCQSCSVPVMERMELQSCSSDVEFTVPEGVYIISGTIYTDCGEVITVGPLTKDIGSEGPTDGSRGVYEGYSLAVIASAQILLSLFCIG
jgi:hypothetical protein